jgi:Phosphodiester glycosidase
MPVRSMSVGRMRRVLSLSVGVAGLVAVVTASAAGASPGSGTSPGGERTRGPVGSGDSAGFVNQISWTATSPARGVTLLSGSYHDPNSHPYWTVVIQAPTSSPFTGAAEFAEAGSAAWAAQAEGALTAQGFTPSATVLPWPDYADDPHGVMGTRVRVGNFATQADAVAEVADLASAGFTPANGFSPRFEWTGFDAQPGPDAELLHAVIVDPHQFAGQVVADHGSAIASRQSAPDASAALGSLAATNGGFFTFKTSFPQLAPADGVNTGVSVYHGQLESLANGDRAAVILNNHQPARIEDLTTTATLSAGHSSIAILGINRVPGSAEDCGVAGFTPTSSPRQSTLCTGTNDLVLFTPEFGAALPTAVAPATSATAVQAVLDGQDRVLSLGPVGSTLPLPPGESAIQALGTQATWISANVHVGDRLAIDEQIRTAAGAPVSLTPTTSIASAGPMLLCDGHQAIDAVDEGVLDPHDLNNYTFSAYRHARTIAGTDAHGRLILVTADGGAFGLSTFGQSEGLSLTEEAALMRSLGAVDAMNLDGGGSTQFAANGQLVGLINDATTYPNPRPVGGTIEVVPAPARNR